MAKSIEQRTKQLVDSTGRTFLAKNWVDNTSAYSKDLNAPIFKKLGDIAGMTKRYDAAADNFIKFDKQKGDSKKLFLTASPKLDGLHKQRDGLKKELDEIAKDEASSLSIAKD